MPSRKVIDPFDLPSNVKGIRGAMKVYDALLKIGLEVYVPLMYIRHDCVVRTASGTHIDIEIKSAYHTRTKFPLGQKLKGRHDFFIILHYYDTDDSWVIPSKVALKYCSRTQKGYVINLGLKMKDRLDIFKNRYDTLLNA